MIVIEEIQNNNPQIRTLSKLRDAIWLKLIIRKICVPEAERPAEGFDGQ
jgi:hypothetical protein